MIFIAIKTLAIQKIIFKCVAVLFSAHLIF